MTDKEEAKRRAVIIMSLKEGYKQKVTMTAVKWLLEELKIRYDIYNSESLFEQAKELEKQQIIDAYDYMRCIGNFESGEQYYNETFKSE